MVSTAGAERVFAPRLRLLAGVPTTSDHGSNDSTHGEEHLPPPQFETIITFMVISSILASLIEGFFPRKILRVLPQPVVLMLLYVIAGAIAGKPFAVEIEAEIILTIFLPALLTNEALKIKTTPFYKSLLGLIWLIGPALFLGAAIVAVFPYAFFVPEDRFNFNVSMAMGGMFATTDPIAVMMFLAEVMTPRRLSAMVAGESLLNDATSIICVVLFLGLNSGQALQPEDIVFFIVNQLIFSILWGIGVGAVTFIILRFMRVLDSHTLFALSIAMPYLVFTVATYYFKDAKSGVGGSGVLALIPVGLFFNHFMVGVAREEQVNTIKEFWETLSFLATSWLYSLTGLLVGIELASQDVRPIDWAMLLAMYFWVLLARFVVVFISVPVFKYAPGGYGFNLREAVLLAWGGLRGAVGLLLALIIKGNPSVTKRQGQLVLFMMAGVVVLVQLQGVTFPLMLRLFKVVIQPNARVHDALRTKMSYRAFFVLTRAGVSPEQARDMLQVAKKKKKKHGKSEVEKTEPAQMRFSTRRREKIMVEDPDMIQHPITSEWVSKSLLDDKRRRLVQAQRATYNSLVSRELISRSAWLILTRAAEIQLDRDEIGTDQWEALLASSRRACCNTLGRHTLEVKALLNSLFSRDLHNYATTRAELKKKQLMQSQRTRNKNVLQGPISPVSFTDSWDDDKIPLYRKVYRYLFGSDDDDPDAGGDEMRERDFGIDCEEALTFGFVAWAYLIAQLQSEALLAEMFKMDEAFTAFQTEHLALQAEIEGSRSEPAHYLDILALHFPDIARKIKSSQAVAEIKDQVYGYVEDMHHSGLVEHHASKKLLRDADKIVRAIKKLDFPLEPPYSVGKNGNDVLMCPNYHPFYQSNMLQRVKMDDFDVEDPVMALQQALDERDLPITEGFWAKRSQSNASLMSPLHGKNRVLTPSSGESPLPMETQLSFPDAALENPPGEDGEASSSPQQGGFGFNREEYLKEQDGSEDGTTPPPSEGRRGGAGDSIHSRGVSFSPEPSDPEPSQTWSGAVKLEPILEGQATVDVLLPSGENSQWEVAGTPRIGEGFGLAATRLKLVRQVSGASILSGGDEDVIQPMNPSEYHTLINSRPGVGARGSSIRKGFDGF